MSAAKCSCKPVARHESSHEKEVPVAHFFASEEAYKNDQGVLAPASTIGKYMVGGNFQKYMKGNLVQPWIYVKHIHEASDQSVVDDEWSKVTEESIPCISSSFRKMPKKNCGVAGVDAKGAEQNTLQWNQAWMFVVDVYKCQETDPELYHLIKTICLPTFGYHCVSKQGGVESGYIAHQFEKATHIMLMLSDCGKVLPTATAFQSFKNTIKTLSAYILPSNECKFMVLGFALLMEGMRMPKPHANMLCNAMYYGLRDVPHRSVYVDVICSRFHIAKHLMHELLRNAKENAIGEMIFRRKGVPFQCVLRAVPSVYTYYALMYGFTRTVDNRSVFPIFFVDVDEIREDLGTLIFDPPISSSATNEDIMRAIFGEPETKMDVIWQAPPGCSLYRVYRLENTFKKFMLLNGMVKSLAKRVRFFPSVQAFHGDDGRSGYIFSKMVTK